MPLTATVYSSLSPVHDGSAEGFTIDLLGEYRDEDGQHIATLVTYEPRGVLVHFTVPELEEWKTLLERLGSNPAFYMLDGPSVILHDDCVYLASELGKYEVAARELGVDFVSRYNLWLNATRLATTSGPTSFIHIA